jgi:hypothetical protein
VLNKPAPKEESEYETDEEEGEDESAEESDEEESRALSDNEIEEEKHQGSLANRFNNVQRPKAAGANLLQAKP